MPRNKMRKVKDKKNVRKFKDKKNVRKFKDKKNVRDGFIKKKVQTKRVEDDKESKLQRKRTFKKKALLKNNDDSGISEAHRKSSNVLRLVSNLSEKHVSKEESHLDKLRKYLGVEVQVLDKAIDTDSGDSDDDNNFNKTFEKSLSKKDENDFMDEDDYDDGIDEIQIEVETDLKNENDPFVKHLFYDLSDSLLISLQNNLNVYKEEFSWPNLGEVSYEINRSQCEQSLIQKKLLLFEDKKLAIEGQLPKLISGLQIKNEEDTSRIFVKRRLLRHLRAANVTNLVSTKNLLNGFQLELFSILNNYQDFYYPEMNFDNRDSIRTVYCLHALNHVMKTRSIILFHNSEFEKQLINPIVNEISDEYRDQGLVRPKVLIMTPFRNSAYLIIKKLIALYAPGRKGQVAYRKRFQRHYTSGGLKMPTKNPKPDDYQKTFCGSIDDSFRIGVSVSNNGIKLFVDFYQADIIVASPLALRILIGAQGERKRDFDYLASIELLILDQTEVFLMQNWDHVLHVFNHLHIQPSDEHGTNLNRVRTWSLNGLAKYYRQTVIFSSYNLVEINSVFNKFCQNYAGKLRVLNKIVTGVISQVIEPLPQLFHRIYTDSYQNSIDDRFEFFVNQIFPQFSHNSFMNHCLVYVANYFDYVRIRNFFRKEDVDFVQISEYSKDNKIAKARDMFFHGESHFLLYSERFHFFRRIRVKGIRHIIFYQLPNIPHFYSELCNLIQESNQFGKVNMSDCTVTVLYTKYDINQLSATINSDQAAKIITSEKNIHLFKTENKSDS